MATLLSFEDVSPTVGKDVFLAPTSVLIGDVRVADGANIWFGAVLRGDFSHIEIGPGASIQDNAVLHCADGLPTIVGARALIGHAAVLEGCVIGDQALVGMGSVVCQHARIEAGAMLAAGSVVPERALVMAGVLAAGVPAQPKKSLDGVALGWTEHAAAEYQRLTARYRSQHFTYE